MSGTSTIACTQPRPLLFGSPLIPSKPRLRFVDGAGDGAAGSGDDDKGGDGDDDKGKDGAKNDAGDKSKSTLPTTQDELDRIVGERLAREREKFKDHDQLKKDSEELTKLREKTKTDDERAIDTAREEGRTEVRAVLAQERVKVALERELSGRIPDAGALLDLDRTQFVSGEGANVDAIKVWVLANSTEAPKDTGKQKDAGQGRRDGSAGGGSVQAGREAYEQLHSKKSTSTSS
ncbi:MAG: hypothetical protein ABIQ01_05690 [Pseudolysinimonas sp.]